VRQRERRIGKEKEGESRWYGRRGRSREREDRIGRREGIASDMVPAGYE
jgi:hypothetical protein